MGRAYRIKRYDHVTSAKRRRLLEQNLIPLLDGSAEQAPDIQSFLKEGDWLIDYRDNSRPIYIFRVKAYRHEPHLHLYVKHFVEAENMYRLGPSQVSDGVHILLAKSQHLELLPAHVYEMLEAFQDKTKNDPNEKVKQLIFLLEAKRNLLNSQGKQLIAELDSGRLSATDLKGILNKQLSSSKIVRGTKVASAVKHSVELVDPDSVSGAISRAALDAYVKKHDGQLPTVKEFEKITKRFVSNGGRRRMRR